MKTIVVLLVGAALAASADEGHHEERGHHEEHGHGQHEHAAARSVEVAGAVQKVMGLKTVRPERRRMVSTRTLNGRFELSSDARVAVPTPVAGRVSLKVRTLERVEAGQTILSVSSPDLVARAREIDILERRLKVYRESGASNAQLESELAVKRAERAALLANAEESDGVVAVKAPSAGVVEAVRGRDGAYLEAGAEVVQLVRPSALRFKTQVSASDAAQLSDGLPARIGDARGEIRIGVGDETGVVPVYAVFAEGSVKGRAGERATVECVLDESEEPVVAVPTRSIVQVGLQPTVFVKDDHDADRFLAVPVTPGLAGGGWTAVAGLPEEDAEVVVEGAYELKLALPSGAAKPAGHFHADGTFHEEHGARQGSD